MTIYAMCIQKFIKTYKWATKAYKWETLKPRLIGYPDVVYDPISIF